MQVLARDHPFAQRHRLVDELRDAHGRPRAAFLQEEDVDVLLEEIGLLEVVAQVAADLAACVHQDTPRELVRPVDEALRRWRA